MPELRSQNDRASKIWVVQSRGRFLDRSDVLESAKTLALDLRAQGHSAELCLEAPRGNVAKDGPLLLFVHGETPVDWMHALRERSEAPICLFGPFAAERCTRAGAEFALVGPLLQQPAQLVEAIQSGSKLDKLSQIPRLLFRTAGAATIQRSQDWSTPRFEDWNRASTDPKHQAFSLDRRALPASPRVGDLVLPNRSQAQSLLDPEAATEGSLPHFDPTWMSFAPRDSHPIDLLDRGYSLCWEEGVRDFRLHMDDPFRVWPEWLSHLTRAETVPKSMEFSPTLAALKTHQSNLERIFRLSLECGVKLRLRGIPFCSFIDRSARLQGSPHSHWETRAAARFLTHLSGKFPGHDFLSDHQVTLYDPWTTIEELLDHLQALEEDAPFLKDSIDPTSRLPIRSNHSRIGRQAESESLLRESPTETGFEFRFADIRMEQFSEVYPAALVPLFEAVGRMRLERELHDWTMIEAKLRWARELALFLQAKQPDLILSENWGQIVARVVQELQIDRPRSAS